MCQCFDETVDPNVMRGLVNSGLSSTLRLRSCLRTLCIRSHGATKSDIRRGTRGSEFLTKRSFGT